MFYQHSSTKFMNQACNPILVYCFAKSFYILICLYERVVDRLF